MRIKHFCVFLIILSILTEFINTQNLITENKIGNIDGYSYELWKDEKGKASMTLLGGGKFSCSWEGIGNALFRIGKKWDCTKYWNQLGKITVNYNVDYRPNGNSYLCVYGWTKQPLIEYYIVDSWGTWRPPGGNPIGNIWVDGGNYDLYVTERKNAPSIEGNKDFKQYWSVRKEGKTSGTISVTEHFQAWANKGMNLGLMYEASLTIEGYESSGSANVNKNDIYVS